VRVQRIQPPEIDMKSHHKLLMAMALGFAGAFTMTPTQAQSPGTSDLGTTNQERNKAVVRAYLDEIVNQDKLDAFERYFSGDVVFNNSKDVKQQMARRLAIRRAFPDHRVVIEDQIAEGDKVVTRVTFKGTHSGDFNGVPATGRQVEYSGISMDRFVNGKLVEMWHLSNTQGLMQQLTVPAAAGVKN
jgi:steroid delta-isomerase-like uncharacterized protein